MRRIISVIFIAACLALSAAFPAMAKEVSETLQSEEFSGVQSESRELYAASDELGLRLTLDQPQSELQCNVPVTFTMTPVNGSGDMGDVVEFNGQQKPRYMYLVNTVMMKDESTGGYTSVVDPTSCKYAESNQFSFTFTSPGAYYIQGYVMDFGTEPVRTARAKCAFVIIDETAQSLDDVANGIVNDCLEAGCRTDYEKALYFHDWIIGHAVYDYSGTYMGAEGVLMRGKGTCESYYRALELLLGKVGIPSARAEGNGHVWNCVCLDGEWTQIDATWDGGYSGSLAYIQHLYFGVTDDMIKKAHSDHEPVDSRPCTSYERNYFIRSGEISRWTSPLETTIRERLTAGETVFTIEAEYNPYPNVYHIIYPMAAYTLNQKLQGEGLCTVAYDSESRNFTVGPITGEEGGNTGSGVVSGCSLGHSFANGWVQSVAPTCTGAGKMQRICNLCGVTEEKSIPATGHRTMQTLSNGTKRTVCTVCKTVLAEQRVKVTLNVTTLPLQVKKSTRVLRVAAKDKMDAVAHRSSSNRKIIRVDARSGKITAKKTGKAYVTVTMKSGASARCLIKVQKKKVTVSKIKVSASKLYMKKGQKLALRTIVTPLTATDKVKYSSSKKKVVSVNKKGMITAKKKGKAKITVRAGRKMKTIRVIVR